MTEINEARFTINGFASVDPVTGNRGYIATNSEVLTVQLEDNPTPALSVLYEVYDSNDGSSPKASKDAPDLTWTASGTAKQTLSSPTGTTTITMPATGAHSYLIRATVSLASGPKSFERLVAIKKTSVTPNLRKVIPGETEQFLTRGWSDAQNDLVDAIDSVVAGALSMDGSYNTFGSNPAIVHVDGAEGQGKALSFDIVGDRHFLVDCTNANAASGGNGWSIPYGFKVFYDTKDFYIGRGDNNDLAMRGHLGDIQLSATEAIEINTDKSLSLRGKAVTLANWGPTTEFSIDYDKLGDGDTSFGIKQDSITKLAVDSDGNTVFSGIAKHPDGSVSAPSIAWTDYPTNGLYRPATWGDAVGVAVNGQTGLIVNYNTLASAPATNVYNASGQSYLFQITANVHGSAADIGTHTFVGLNSSPASFTYAGIVGHCVDDTASSEDGRLDLYAAAGGALLSRMSVGAGVVVGSGSDPGAGNLFVADTLYLDDGSTAAPSLSFPGDTDTGIRRASDNAMSLVANEADALIVNYNAGYSAPTTIVNNNTGMSYLFSMNGADHGSAVDIGTHRYLGKNSSSGPAGYCNITVRCEDDTAGSHYGSIRFNPAVNGGWNDGMTIQEGVRIGAGTDPGGGSLFVQNDILQGSTGWHYWGASDTDGSWRMGRSGNDMVLERRESSVWVNKQTFAA